VRANNIKTYKCHYWVHAPTAVSTTMYDDIALDIIYYVKRASHSIIITIIIIIITVMQLLTIIQTSIAYNTYRRHYVR